MARKLPPIPQYAFLKGGGEMGELIAAYNWSKTSLGSISNWPQNLRAAVSLMLKSRFPMLIFWGPELITFYNDAFRPSLGDDGKHPGSLWQRGEQSWAESWPVIGPMIYNIMAGGDAVWFEDQKLPLYRDGRMGYAYWTYSFSPIDNGEGIVAGLLVTCAETTKAVEGMEMLTEANQRLETSLEKNRELQKAQHKAHIKLQENQRQLLSLFEQSPVALATIARQNLTFTSANHFYGELVGRKTEEIIGKPLLQALPELAGQGFEKLLNGVLETEVAFVADEVAAEIMRNGSMETIYINLAYQPMKDEADKVSAVLVVAVDITPQVAARKELEENTTQMQAMIQSAPFPIGVYIGREMRIRFANQSIKDVYGKGNDVEGRLYTEVLPELATQEVFEQLTDVYDTGIAFHSGTRRVALEHSGRLIPYYFNYSFTPLFNNDGKVYGIMNTAADVTELETARQKLAENEAALLNAIELAELGTWFIDLVNNKATFAPRIADWFGAPSGSNLEDLFAAVPEADALRMQQTISTAIQPGNDGFIDIEHVVTNNNTGQERIIHSKGQVLLGAEGVPIGLVGTGRDVTLLRQTQGALENLVQQRTEELAAAVDELRATNEELAISNEQLTHSNEELAQYAYVASHDLQEPLRKIQVFSGMLAGKTKVEDGSRELVDKIGGSASRMGMLIRDLLDFSRLLKSDSLFRPTDIGKTVADVLSDFELTAKEKGAQFKTGSLPVIEAVGLQMNQLFYNLVSNALKFIRPGVPPIISVTSEAIENDKVEQYIRTPLPFARYYRICIKDNGIGFETKYADQIFEVFKRLHGRDTYPGSGIGLALCRRIIANHNGYLYTESTPGKGSTFCLIMPDRQTDTLSELPEGFTFKQ